MSRYTGRTALREVLFVHAALYIRLDRSWFSSDEIWARMPVVCGHLNRRHVLSGDTRRYFEVIEYVWTANDMVYLIIIK